MKKILIILSFVFTLNSIAQTKLDSGLIAYYPLNNNIKDGTKNKYDGQLSDGSFTTDRFGRANSALYFDGVDDYASILKFGKYIPTKDFSICFWAKSVKNVVSNTLMIMPDNTSNRIAASLYYSHNGQGAFFWDYAGIGSRIFIEPVNPDGSWEHVTVYYNSKTKKTGFYKNAKLLQEVATTLSYTQDSTKALNIGKGADGYYNGTLDDIRFYNRILDTIEIKALFTMPSSGIKSVSQKENHIKIVPDSYNPKIFNINSQNPLNTITVHSLSGQLMNQSEITTIDLTTYPSGIYYIQIMDSEGNMYMKKILI